MSEYVLQNDLYLGVSPAGSYYAVQEKTDEVGRSFLQRLLQTPETPLFSNKLASEYSNLDKKSSLEFIHWLQTAGLVYGTETPEEAPQDRLEDILPDLLQPVADSGKVVVASSLKA